MTERETLIFWFSVLWFGGGGGSDKEIINNCILRAKENFDLYCSFFRSLTYPGFVSSHRICLKCAQQSTLCVSDFQNPEICGLLIPVTPPLHQCRVFWKNHILCNSFSFQKSWNGLFASNWVAAFSPLCGYTHRKVMLRGSFNHISLQ